jgi:hypothetical protein
MGLRNQNLEMHGIREGEMTKLLNKEVGYQQIRVQKCITWQASLEKFPLISNHRKTIMIYSKKCHNKIWKQISILLWSPLKKTKRLDNKFSPSCLFTKAKESKNLSKMVWLQLQTHEKEFEIISKTELTKKNKESKNW